MKTCVPGSKKLPGAIFNVRLMHGPEGVSPMDGTNIPATKQKNTSLTFFGWPFLLVDLVLNLNRYGFD